MKKKRADKVVLTLNEVADASFVLSSVHGNNNMHNDVTINAVTIKILEPYTSAILPPGICVSR